MHSLFRAFWILRTFERTTSDCLAPVAPCVPASFSVALSSFVAPAVTDSDGAAPWSTDVYLREIPDDENSVHDLLETEGWQRVAETVARITPPEICETNAKPSSFAFLK